MSLAKEVLAFLDMPNTLEQLSKEIQKEIINVMSKVQELQTAFDEMKQTLADEASELFTMFDELKAQIDAKVDPSSLDPIIADIMSSIGNVEALSEGRPVTPAPTDEVPAEEAPTPVEETPTPTEGTPADGGTGSTEEPTF